MINVPSPELEEFYDIPKCMYCAVTMSDFTGVCDECSILLKEIRECHKKLTFFKDKSNVQCFQDIIDRLKKQLGIKDYTVSWKVQCTRVVYAKNHEDADDMVDGLETSITADSQSYVEGSFDINEGTSV